MSSKANLLAPEASLVALPYELREPIFHYYFKADGGYVYDAESDKLVTADGQPIDLSLMYTCRSIADDTRHMPLSINTITFSAACRQGWRAQAGGLAFIVGFHHELQVDMVQKLSGFITPEMFSLLGRRFPQFMPVLRDDLRRMQGRYRSWGSWRRPPHWVRVQSVLEDFIGGIWYPGILPASSIYYWCLRTTVSSLFGAFSYALRLLAEKHPNEVIKLLDRSLPGWTSSHPLHELFDLSLDPWAIPSLSQVVAKGNQLRAQTFWKNLEGWYHNSDHRGTGDRYREKLYFSAAAIAIRFLDRLPKQQRLYIRNIILKEDRVAVGHPQCHVLGLVPFCRENPRLHVERHVNLWRCILPQWKPPSPEDAASLAEDHDYRIIESQTSGCFVKYKLIIWLSHALEVMDEGMPPGSFSFVLDGEPDLNLSTDIFNTAVHQEVVWQKSLSECIARGLFRHPKGQEYLMAERLLRPLELLLSGSSILRSNFNLGQPRGYDELLEEHQDPSEDSWLQKMKNRDPGKLEISNPALDPAKLTLELFEKQSESDYLHSSLGPCKREKKRLRRVRRTWAAAEAEADSGLDSDSDTDLTPELRYLFGEGMSWSEKRLRRRARRQKRKRRNERREQRAAAERAESEVPTETELADIEGAAARDEEDTASDV